MKGNTPILQVLNTAYGVVAPKDTLEQVCRIFKQFDTRHVPVVSDGKLVGIVSYSDFLEIVRSGDSCPSEDKLRSVFVEQVMTRDVRVLPHDATWRDAMAIFEKMGFHALPVTNREGALLGMVTFAHLLDLQKKSVLSPDF